MGDRKFKVGDKVRVVRLEQSDIDAGLVTGMVVTITGEYGGASNVGSEGALLYVDHFAEGALNQHKKGFELWAWQLELVEEECTLTSFAQRLIAEYEALPDDALETDYADLMNRMYDAAKEECDD